MARTKKEIYKEIKFFKHELKWAMDDRDNESADRWLDKIKEAWMEIKKIGFSKDDTLKYGMFLTWSWKIEDKIAA